MRLLVIGGGDRALELSRQLTASGHAVRLVAGEADREAVEAAGAELWVGDPDRIESLRYAVDGVTVLLWCLADRDEPELHGSRWHMMLERTVDSVVRAVVYEAGGVHGEAGLAELRSMAERNEIPWSSFDAGAPDWPGAARAAVAAALGAPAV